MNKFSFDSNSVFKEQSDVLHEECGIIGIALQNSKMIGLSLINGLSTLQHRGQEAAGVAILNKRKLFLHKGLGPISQVFTPDIMSNLQGEIGIGHTRYSTTGSSSLKNTQPFLVGNKNNPVTIAHNGNLINSATLRNKLIEQGVYLKSTTDSEVMAEMLLKSNGNSWEERITNCMDQWVGAFSLLIMESQFIYAIRDPWGMRPLSIGKLKDGGYAAASETCALEAISCEEIAEVKPGEIISFSRFSISKKQGRKPALPLAICTFEHIYFSRPDSIMDGKLIYDVRQKLGHQLALESPANVDLVLPIPDSSIPSAIGYAQTAKIPYEHGIIRNSYIGRTFIMPNKNERSNSVLLKFMPLPMYLKGKKIVLVDDSIIRGNTVKAIVAKLREAGVDEIHLRITCPPIRHPCYMGIDIGDYKELIAHSNSITELIHEFNVDSLHFLSLGKMMEAIGSTSGYCNACFTGKYPFKIVSKPFKHIFDNI